MFPPMRLVAWAPEHRHPHDGDERELGEDDGELTKVGELLKDPLHATPLCASSDQRNAIGYIK